MTSTVRGNGEWGINAMLIVVLRSLGTLDTIN